MENHQKQVLERRYVDEVKLENLLDRLFGDNYTLKVPKHITLNGILPSNKHNFRSYKTITFSQFHESSVLYDTPLLALISLLTELGRNWVGSAARLYLASTLLLREGGMRHAAKVVSERSSCRLSRHFQGNS
jgi:hypothetical protein